jgi:hypothetical protein
MGVLRFLSKHVLPQARERAVPPPAAEPEFARSFRERFFADVPVDLDAMEFFRIEHFPESGPQPWLDSPDARNLIRARVGRGELSSERAELCEKWSADGYVIVKGLFDHDFLDRVWASYEASIADGTVALQPEKISDDDPHPGRFLNPHFHVPALGEVLHHPDLLEWVSLLLGRELTPFQTITSHKGSQQGVHSDTIHMTTYPLGYLAAAWVAFEDIDAGSGPLVFYPGSHKLPYLSSKAVGIKPGDFAESGYATFEALYEPAIRALIDEQALAPSYFTAAKGDVLVWHANLLHGGSLRRDVSLSRRAVVCHYFARGAVCYHDLSGGRAAVGP